MSANLSEIATRLLDAQDHAHTVALLSETEEPLSGDDAYAIQAETIARRLARGEVVVGRKLGLTSKAKQEAMHVAEPIFGVLTSAGVLHEGEPVPVAELIHARVEPEVILILGSELKGPGVDEQDALAACSGLHFGFEVIDSRYENFRFTFADVVADNTSAARFVVSDEPLPEGTDLVNVECVLEVDGKEVERATGAAVLGNPLTALALLANWLGEHGESLPAGSIVMTGGLTNAVALTDSNSVVARFGNQSIEIHAGK